MSIQTLRIKNVQSHKDSVLNFSDGINILVGSSNNGKSAVLRALNWCIRNRPLGTDILLSSWSYDNKGKQIEEMSVEVEKNNSTLIRKKSSTENSYVINGEKLEAIKTDVPDEVNDFFKMSETNFQTQMESPFLLSQTAGEVAKYFNKVVRLDVIDRVLTNAESSRRKLKSKLEDSEEVIEKLEKEVEDFNWLDSVERLIIKCENIENKKNSLESDIELLEKSLNSFSRLSENKKKYEDLLKLKDVVKQFNEVYESVSDSEEEIENLEKSLKQFNELSKNKFNNDFTAEKKMIELFEKENSKVENLQNLINHLGTSIANVDYYEKQISENKNNIKELKKQLPKICPLCGGILNKNGECKNEK